MNPDDTASLIYYGLLGMVISGWLFSRYRHNLGQAIQQALLWVLLFMGVILLYGFKDDLKRSVFASSTAVIEGERITLSRANDQHFYLTLNVNGQNVDFIVDTGATGVVLSRADARLVGFDPDKLMYMGVASTANGEVRTARVKLKDVQLGEISDHNVTAWVNDGELEFSLLGMTYLSRYSRIEISGDKLFLTR